MSDAKKVAVRFEYRDNHGRCTNNRLLTFKGELDQQDDGSWAGSASPVYAPLQSFGLSGKIDLATGEVELKAQGPIDLDCKPWDPQPAYLWSINLKTEIVWYCLPDILYGRVRPSAKEDNTYKGKLDRRNGKLIMTINEA